MAVNISRAMMEAPESGVTVRMYRAGFGDCFLLAFRGADGDPVHMLIDCGVHSQYKGGSERICRIVDHVHASTGGRLAVVAVTHEHADHISGFYAARNVFKDMDIGEAWFGWTEEPGNPAADKLRADRALTLAALQITNQRLAETDTITAGNIDALLQFHDVFGVSGADAMNVLRGKVANPRYLKPKCPPLSVPGVDAVRVFVLGPPEDSKYLMSPDPSGKPGEVYTERALTAALLGVAGSEGSFDGEDFQPFAGNYRIPAAAVREPHDRFSFFRNHYGFGDRDPDAWRRIDVDWQCAAESLALKLDSATNNTSLVLAIELRNTGRVLLFTGDAQVGNWESWHEGGWSEENGLRKGETITAKDLLERTVLYKVGHHGSHNATLRQKGLEMMISEELTAMVPVDQDWAEARKPRPWRMPFEPLYADLRKRTRGRILRTDVGYALPLDETPAWSEFPLLPRVDDLFVELSIEDRQRGRFAAQARA